ncbi:MULTISPECIES: DUF2516 family protein [Gordonia]|jgi:ribose/xylose/arabinose/galactoside ABC-type transport system permease subunit|uniref:DUF2516 family protein n=1 Tax=Gordonia TaxID=2053 RepID=UPI0032B4DC09
MNFFSAMATGQMILILVISIAAALAAVVALIHAAVQRPDAFTAVDRQSKVIWVSILAASAIVLVFFGFFASGIMGILAIAAIVATLVYLVDVRKRVDAIQNKSWFRKLN